MRNWLIPFFFVCIVSALPAVVVGPADALTDHLERAYQSYQTGVAAQTVEGKEQSFNRALRLYLQLEGEPGDGKLYYNIANTYFQLEQYGWAILYYLRAQQLMPRDDRIQFHLALAQAQQGIAIEPPQKWKQRLFFWHYELSQAERIQAFIAFGIVVLLFASIVVWSPNTYAKRFAGIVTFAWMILLVSLLYFQYWAPVEGVMVKAFGLYHGPAEDYALVNDEPFIPGTQVRIERTAEDGWLRVTAPDGKSGYVPSDVIRII